MYSHEQIDLKLVREPFVFEVVDMERMPSTLLAQIETPPKVICVTCIAVELHTTRLEMIEQLYRLLFLFFFICFFFNGPVDSSTASPRASAASIFAHFKSNLRNSLRQ